MQFESRFAAGAYRDFRPPWPAEVLRLVLARARPPRRRAVDLGAGTGLATLRLAEHYDEVVAVEPDAAMLAQLDSAGNRIRKVAARAEDARCEPGTVDLVTAANAFHWMDGAAVCERARGWLRDGGVLAVFRYDPPHAAEGALGRLLDEEYEGRWGAHVHARLRDPDYSQRTVAESSFGPTLEVVRLANPLELAHAELLGFCRSTSYAGGYARSLADPEAYWQDLSARIRSAAGGGPYRIDFRVELVTGQK